MVRIPITNRDAEDAHSLGEVAAEMDGPAGADLTGGDLTSHQSAAQTLDDVTATRRDEEGIWEAQNAGDIATQTQNLKPSGANPRDGLPDNPHNSENTGGSSGFDRDADFENDEIPDSSMNNQTVESDFSDQVETESASNEQAEETLSEEESLRDQLLRVAADFENFKRQAQRRESEVRERAVKGVLEDLLPVLDNFDRAVGAAQNARDVESLRVGVQYILQQFEEALRANGVEPIEARGQKFDPLHHEAIEEVSDSGETPGTIVEETQRGYSYQGRILRPSRVKVAG